MKKLFCIVFVLFSGVFYGQKNDFYDDLDYEYSYDTVVAIDLEEIKLLPKLNFNTSLDKKYYYWFRKKVLKAYPYAIEATTYVNKLNERLLRIKSKRKRKKYTKFIQKYFEETFTSELKKLTRTEGRILLKLIHRQTGKTTFNVIKELRSGWKAFWYNTTASMFKLSLKSEYDPATVKEDYLIEDILHRAFSRGTLHEHQSKLPIDFYNITIDTLKIAPRK